MGACLGTGSGQQNNTSSTQKSAPKPASEYSKRQEDSRENKELGDRAYQLGNYEQAAELYSEAINDADQQDTNNVASLYADRAAALGSLGRHAEAVGDCEQALRLKPDYPIVLLRKGRLHIRLGQWLLATQALEACRDSASANPATAQEAISVLGQIASHRREYQEKAEREQKAEADAEAAKRKKEDKENAREQVKTEQARDAAEARRTANETHSVGLYADLGIKWSATASEVKHAYRKLSLIHHPDKNRGDPAAGERFKIIKNAFEILSNEGERRTYDAGLRADGFPVPSEAERKRKSAEDDARKERERQAEEAARASDNTREEAETEQAEAQAEEEARRGADRAREKREREAEEAAREKWDEPRKEVERKPAVDAANETRSVGLYADLGIKWSATASEVKKAYHALSLTHHPDKNRGDPAAGERFKIIKNAFEILSDEAQRRAYDAGLRAKGFSVVR